MTQQVIDNGTVEGDGTGESAFDAFAKVNAMFDEVYTSFTLDPTTGFVRIGNRPGSPTFAPAHPLSIYGVGDSYNSLYIGNTNGIAFGGNAAYEAAHPWSGGSDYLYEGGCAYLYTSPDNSFTIYSVGVLEVYSESAYNITADSYTFSTGGTMRMEFDGTDWRIGGAADFYAPQQIRVSGNVYVNGRYVWAAGSGQEDSLGCLGSGKFRFNNHAFTTYGYFDLSANNLRLYTNTDSTAAIELTKADGTTPVLTVDTTNGGVKVLNRLEITAAAPGSPSANVSWRIDNASVGSPNDGLKLTPPTSGSIVFSDTGDVSVSGRFSCNGQTPAAAPTGYGTPTNGALSSSFDATTITHADLAKEVAALIVHLKSIGFLAA